MLGTSLRKDILPIASPIFLGMLVFQVQTLTNRAFLGHIDVQYLSVISNVVFPMWTMTAMLNALATGATILMSQSLGAGNTARARQVAAAALKWNSVASLALAGFWFTSSGLVFRLMGLQGEVLEQCISYTRIASISYLFTGASGAMTSAFQAAGTTRPLMYAGALRSGLNVLLDWLLIFGSLGFPRLGLLGAAAASVISDVAGAALLAALFFGNRHLPTRPALRAAAAAPLRDYGHVVRMGIPTSFEELTWNIGNLVLIRFLNELDPLATAVYSLVFSIEILPIVTFISLGQTTTVLVGRAKGAGDLRRGLGAALTAQAAAWAVSAALAVVFAVAPRELVGVFTRDSDVISRAAPILFVSCFTFFPRSVNFIAGSAIRGLGRTGWMLGTQVAGTAFIIAAGWTLIFGAGLGVIGLFLAMLADETVRAVANTLRFLAGVRLRDRGTIRIPAAAAPAAMEEV